jgi:hypothetical protein
MSKQKRSFAHLEHQMHSCGSANTRQSKSVTRTEGPAKVIHATAIQKTSEKHIFFVRDESDLRCLCANGAEFAWKHACEINHNTETHSKI